MREILFRGKTFDNIWVIGELFTLRGESTILHKCTGFIGQRTVYHETIGQYTGLTDKNGKKIFEGDIIEFADHCNGGTCIGKIQYSDEDTAFQILYDENVCCLLGYNFHGAELEILGNIHDNPELVGGANE